MNNEKPENISSESDASTAEDKRTLSENAEESQSRVKKEIKPPETLVDFIKSIYSGSKINKTTRTAFKLYQDTISTLGPKIMVSGEQPHLSNERNANKVRALLLAGIRSAVLWKQCGGSRWQFLFGRNAYKKECERILGRV